MATKEEILDAIAGMTVLELSELLKEFEEKFGVTAAAPVAVAAAAAAGGGGGGGAAEGGEGRVRRHPHRRRRQEDPGHQGGPRAHQPRPEGGQGPGRRRPQARAREGVEGGRREGQGAARGRRRHRRAQVVAGPRARPAGPPEVRADAVLDASRRLAPTLQAPLRVARRPKGFGRVDSVRVSRATHRRLPCVALRALAAPSRRSRRASGARAPTLPLPRSSHCPLVVLSGSVIPSPTSTRSSSCRT